MSPPNVTGAMGVLITAAIFLNGFTAVRWQAYLADAPKRYALIDQEQRDVFRPPPGFLAALAALALLGVNGGLFALGVRLAGDEARDRELVLAILVAFVAAHGIVAAITVLQIRNAKKDDRKAYELSALAAYLRAAAVPDATGSTGRLTRCQERVGLFALALDRVPPDIPSGTYRRGLRDARVRYAEALLDERRPDAALAQIDLTSGPEWSPDFLRAEGAEKTADWLDDLFELKVAQLRARAHRLTGDVDAEFDAWLHTLRTAPSEFRAVRELLDAAQRSGRVPDLHQTVVALVSGEQKPEWAEPFFTKLAASLVPGRVMIPAGLDELRLFVDATGRRWATVVLVRRLLETAEATEPDARGDLLEEVDGLLSRFHSEGHSDPELVELEARKLVLDGRLGEAYEHLAARYAEAVARRGRWHRYPELLVTAAREAGRTGDLRCIVDAHRSAGVLDRVVEMLDATPPE